MPHRRTLVLDTAQRQALVEQRDHSPHPDLRERCAAVLKIADGASPHAVAQTGLLRPRDPDTVYGWLTYFETAGLDGLREHRHGGPRRRRRL